MVEAAPHPDPSSLPPEALDLAAKLFDLARSGEVAQMQAYLTAGIPINMLNSSGDTFLMLASYHNRAPLVELLIQKGADVNLTNDKGQTPLAGAVFKDHMEVVKLLVEKGNADPNAGKPTALQTAAMFRHWECARIMGLEKEARELGPTLNPVGSRDALSDSVPSVPNGH